MQMQVLPAHRDLQHGIQLGDRRVAGHPQAPPDQRGDGAQRDFGLIDPDGRLLRGGAHEFPYSGRWTEGRRCAAKRTFSLGGLFPLSDTFVINQLNIIPIVARAIDGRFINKFNLTPISISDPQSEAQTTPEVEPEGSAL